MFFWWIQTTKFRFWNQKELPQIRWIVSCFLGLPKSPPFFFAGIAAGPKPAIGYIHSKHWKFQLVLISKKTHRSPKINHPNCQIQVGNHWISKGPVIEKNNPSNLIQLIPAMASHHLTSQRQSIALRASDHVMGTESLCFERFDFWQPCYKIPWKPLSFSLTLRHWISALETTNFQGEEKVLIPSIPSMVLVYLPKIYHQNQPFMWVFPKIMVPQNGWWK